MLAITEINPDFFCYQADIINAVVVYIGDDIKNILPSLVFLCQFIVSISLGIVSNKYIGAGCELTGH